MGSALLPVAGAFSAVSELHVLALYIGWWRLGRRVSLMMAPGPVFPVPFPARTGPGRVRPSLFSPRLGKGPGRDSLFIPGRHHIVPVPINN